MVKPFIKWAGGKGQLLTQLEMYLPQRIYDEEFTYVEPFVGGGAMLFFMLQKFPNIRRVIINDINTTLVRTYRVIQNTPEQLIERLSEIQNEYYLLAEYYDRKQYFMNLRRMFNESQMNDVDKSALLIFLNHTCFNGLYRENSSGKFNVPFGKYDNPKICNADNIMDIHDLFLNVDLHILNGDFSRTINLIEDDLNFFYFDPPYRPLSTTSSFNSYSRQNFNDEKQVELANFCRRLSEMDNCMWMLSNSDCSAKNPDDRFFENIYDGYNLNRVNASRNINAIASKRGKLTELLVTNYGVHERNEAINVNINEAI